MTDEQIEKAARKLCELRDKDPDAIIFHGDKTDDRGLVDIVLNSPRWELVAKEIRQQLQLEEAIATTRPIRCNPCLPAIIVMIVKEIRRTQSLFMENELSKERTSIGMVLKMLERITLGLQSDE